MRFKWVFQGLCADAKNGGCSRSFSFQRLYASLNFNTSIFYTYSSPYFISEKEGEEHKKKYWYSNLRDGTNAEKNPHFLCQLVGLVVFKGLLLV